MRNGSRRRRRGESWARGRRRRVRGNGRHERSSGAVCTSRRPGPTARVAAVSCGLAPLVHFIKGAPFDSCRLPRARFIDRRVPRARVGVPCRASHVGTAPGQSRSGGGGGRSGHASDGASEDTIRRASMVLGARRVIDPAALWSLLRSGPTSTDQSFSCWRPDTEIHVRGGRISDAPLAGPSQAP